MPAELKGVPAKVLDPRKAWDDKAEYDDTRQKLAGMFKNNFTKFVKVSPRNDTRVMCPTPLAKDGIHTMF